LLQRPIRALQDSARTVSSTLAALGSDEQTQLLAIAVAIGAAAGVAVIVFHRAIDIVQDLVLRSALHVPSRARRAPRAPTSPPRSPHTRASGLPPR
jgi:hypothetical protein